MPKLIDLLVQRRQLFANGREIERLRAEVAKLSSQSDRIQHAIRRCVTCDYRLEVVGKRDSDPTPNLES